MMELHQIAACLRSTLNDLNRIEETIADLHVIDESDQEFVDLVQSLIADYEKRVRRRMYDAEIEQLQNLRSKL